MKLICGVGINDSDYQVQPVIDGKRMMCPFYQKWTDVLKRCYSKATQKRCPTYVGCEISEEWKTFSIFKAWMKSQDWEGNQLDKDILLEGNKIYGPNTCVFVSQALNSLLLDNAASRGEFPIGVNKHGDKYQAQVTKGGRQKYLGRFDTPEAAHEAWRIEKAKIILSAAELTTDVRVKEALTKKARSLR